MKGLNIQWWNGLLMAQMMGDDAAIHIAPDIVKFIDGVDLNGKIVIDGGSNMGAFSIYASRKVGDGKVYAFEIQRLIFQISCMNYIMNGAKDIVALNMALSNDGGKWVGHTPLEKDNPSSVGVKTEPLEGKIKRYDKAETVRLDDWGLENIGLIKLDLEGYEPEALSGMWETIKRCKPHLIIELSDGYLSKPIREMTIEHIKDIGYECIVGADHNYFFKPI